MEVIAPVIILSIGYLLNQGGVNRPKLMNLLEKVPKNAQTNGPDPGNSWKTVEIFKEEQSRCNKLYEQSKNSIETNVMIPGPPIPIFNKTDGAISHKIPIEFQGPAAMAADAIKNISETKKYTPLFNAPPNDMTVIGDQDRADASGWENLNLLGFPVQRSEFRHNNEIPFFGGTIRQSVDEFANRNTLENFTGQNENYIKKNEVKMSSFSPPTANLTNPYGTGNLDGYNYDHYIVSNKQNNVSPTEPIHVGPGLNQGYTFKPTGGFQQANTRDYVLPKSTDQIRVLTNPKVSYAGRIISGKKIGKPGKIGMLMKYRPDNYWQQGPERFFVTTGQSTAGTLRPYINLKKPHRAKYNRAIIGTTGPITGSREIGIRPKAGPVHRRCYRTDPNRNVKVLGSIPGIQNEKSMIPNDYGKKNWIVRDTVRSCIESFPTINKKNDATLGPKRASRPRFTRKLFQIGNNRWSGNVKSDAPSRSYIKNRGDVARTTTKEQTIHNNRDGNLSGPERGIVYDPNNIARTTTKEQTIHNNRDGNLSGPERGIVYDPNDITRTTTKEQTIHNNRDGNLSGPERGIVYDPNDITRTTMKETTFVKDYVGTHVGADQAEMGGYVISQEQIDMKTTEREIQQISYTGGACKKVNTGYNVTEVNAPTTQRETTLHSYTGIAGPEHDEAPASREDIANSTCRSYREQISRGRAPTRNGVKRIKGKEFVHLSTERNTRAINDALEQRAHVPQELNPTYKVPDGQCWLTKEKETVSNAQLASRLDPIMVDAFRNNPFTQSLASFFFS